MTSPFQAGRAAAAVVAAAAHRRRPARRPEPVLHTPADQLPETVLARLRHPSAPAGGHVVRWDPLTSTAVWRPCAVHP